MRKSIFLVLIAACCGFNIIGQTIATLQVNLGTNTNGLAVPASVELDKLTFCTDSLLELAEVNGNHEVRHNDHSSACHI